MARPKKQVVDYFPHVCSHGKTIFILEQKYGNNGYAFWFKLLELLGDTPGHFLDINDDGAWEFLQAKTHLDANLCLEILDLLAKLDAIDRDLWTDHIIWSQNFVDGISDAYKNRKVETPAKPSFYRQEPTQDDVSTGEKPQSKLKETKGNETIINTPISPPEKPEKKSYAEYVFLTPAEHERLIKDYGEADTSRMIEILDNYIGQNPKKNNRYMDHNRVLRGWVKDRLAEEKEKAKPKPQFKSKYQNQDGLSPAAILNGGGNKFFDG